MASTEQQKHKQTAVLTALSDAKHNKSAWIADAEKNADKQININKSIISIST